MPIPAPDLRLFTAVDLTDWLGETVAEDRAASVESVVWGWLKTPLGLDTRPSDVSEQVFSWAIELGGIAHENPAGLDSKTIGPFAEQYSSERREEILAIVGTGSPLGTPPRPRGSFPPARSYPDPAW